MVKQKKGGLGRGLNSLLGVESEVTSTSTPNKDTTQDSTSFQSVQSHIESKADIDKKTEEKKNKASLQKIGQKDNLERIKKEDTLPEHYSQRNTEEINSSIEEENVTIKSVIERPIERTPISISKSNEIKIGKIEKSNSNEVSIELVYPNPNQPRTNFKKQELEELAESIKQNGLLQPILVREKKGRYEIIAGERRWQACRIANLKTIPVSIRNVDDDETITLALIENIQRTDLNPIEEAYGYRRMMERGNMTQTQVAQAVSKGRSTVANSLRLLELPEEAQQLLFEEKITAGHARAILSIPSHEGRIKLTEKLVTESLSVRETEAIARLMSGKNDSTPTEKPKTPKSYKTVARSLREILQTDVRIKNSKGKNKIEISFQDETDLERLFRLITSK